MGNNECVSSKRCEKFRCTAVCNPNPCGKHAVCRPADHRAKCTCPENFVGDPFVSCRPVKSEKQEGNSLDDLRLWRDNQL